jgi:hypothetical protein
MSAHPNGERGAIHLRGDEVACEPKRASLTSSSRGALGGSGFRADAMGHGRPTGTGHRSIHAGDSGRASFPLHSIQQRHCRNQPNSCALSGQFGNLGLAVARAWQARPAPRETQKSAQEWVRAGVGSVAARRRCTQRRILYGDGKAHPKHPSARQHEFRSLAIRSVGAIRSNWSGHRRIVRRVVSAEAPAKAKPIAEQPLRPALPPRFGLHF